MANQAPEQKARARIDKKLVEVFSFMKPDTIADELAKKDTLRVRMRHFPPLDPTGLRACQVRAITKLEESFGQGRSRALVQMATGSGKTFTAITAIYRLLKYVGAKRVLMLVDTKNLGEQAEQELYGVPTGALNQAVKRNIERFPERFMFQLSDEEFKDWKSQIVISNFGGENMISQNPAAGAENWISQNATSNLTGGTVRMGLRKRPFVFTEHGVTMLASVLHSETAVRVSIAVIDAFVAMRRFLISNADVFKRIETVERRQIADQVQNEERFKKVFKALDEKKEKVQGVFYDGQIWDAAAFVERLIASARKSLLLIDNWATVATLDMFTKKRKGVSVKIVTSRHINRKTQMPDIKILPADIAKFNAQYPKLHVCFSESFHDRFLIVDDKDVYLIGASLKDLAKKCFAFTKLDVGVIPGLKRRI